MGLRVWAAKAVGFRVTPSFAAMSSGFELVWGGGERGGWEFRV